MLTPEGVAIPNGFNLGCPSWKPHIVLNYVSECRRKDFGLVNNPMDVPGFFVKVGSIGLLKDSGFLKEYWFGFEDIFEFH
jgi:hypothetical protein